jgi:hypothetical protein
LLPPELDDTAAAGAITQAATTDDTANKQSALMASLFACFN